MLVDENDVVTEIQAPDSQRGLIESCADLLRQADWKIQRNAVLAPSPKGGVLRADILAMDTHSGERIAVYPRWQQSSGSAEEKLPFHLIKFGIAISARPDSAQRAYFVIAGNGWTWNEFYLTDGLSAYMSSSVNSKVVSLEGFKDLVASGIL